MLSGGQWGELFALSGWQEVSHRPVGSSFLVLLRARRPDTAIDLDAAKIREGAATRLLAHMVPERIDVVPWLPLSANGKVDRAAVARLLETDRVVDAFESPQGELEQTVADMWAELLGLSGVGRNQSFFALGGDSLLATRFIEQADMRFGIALPLRRLFAGPTVAAVATAYSEEQADVEEGVL
jgi:hypothetical protein